LRLKLWLGLLLACCPSITICAEQWERLGPEGGMVVSLGAGTDGEVYLGTADGHLFASADGAKSWALRGRIGTRRDGVITRVVVDPNTGNGLFASIWYQEPGTGGGVFRSEDRGKSWKLLGLGNEAVRTLEMAPSEPEEIVAGTRSGVFLSADGGKRWARISPEGDPELRNVDSLVIDPRDPEVIYAGTYHLPWLTRDGGKTWKPVIAGIIDDSDIMSLRLDAANPDRVYMSACSGIYRSESQGAEWTKLQGIPYAARRTQVIVQDAGHPKTLYAGTTEGLWVTRDGGESWARTTSKDWVVNSLAVLARKDGEPGRVVMGTEGQGVLISDDAGASFTEANRGFTHVIVKQLAAERREARHLLIFVERGTPEILESRDEGKSWSSLPLTAIEQGRPATLNAKQVQEILSSPWGWLLQLKNGQVWRFRESQQAWTEWALQPPVIEPEGQTAAAKKASKNEPGQPLLAETAIAFSDQAAVVSTKEGLVRCQESGSCQRLKTFGRGEIRAVWISRANLEIDVVTDGKLGWSTDRGQTAKWRDLPVSPEQIAWLDVAESSVMKTTYLGTSQGIFFSTGENRWQRIEGGLPPGRVGPSLRGPGFWAVSEQDGGLYLSRDDGSSWERIDQDGERGRCAGLVRTETGALLVGSQREGLLRLEPEKSH
jgi:photosystem II stability/assembly factor-like uncharacterized protein